MWCSAFMLYVISMHMKFKSVAFILYELFSGQKSNLLLCIRSKNSKESAMVFVHLFSASASVRLFLAWLFSEKTPKYCYSLGVIIVEVIVQKCDIL